MSSDLSLCADIIYQCISLLGGDEIESLRVSCENTQQLLGHLKYLLILSKSTKEQRLNSQNSLHSALETQSKRDRQLANKAIRNAIENERLAMRANYEQQLTTMENKSFIVIKGLEDELKMLKNQIEKLSEEVESSRRLTDRLVEDHARELDVQRTRVTDALRSEFDDLLTSEKNRMEREMSFVLLQKEELFRGVEATMNSRLEELQEQNRQHERDRSIAEDALRAQLKIALSVKCEAEERILELQKECSQLAANNDATVNSQLLESYAVQAQLKSELSHSIANHKIQLRELQLEHEEAVSKAREDVHIRARQDIENLSRILEEKMNSRERELNAQHELSQKRLRAIHDQEIMRMVRESSRFKNRLAESIQHNHPSDSGKRPTDIDLPLSLHQCDSTMNQLPNELLIGSNTQRASDFLAQLDKYLLVNSDLK